jgi:hypothetical protein
MGARIIRGNEQTKGGRDKQQHKQHKPTTFRWGTTHPSDKGLLLTTIVVNGDDNS